MGWGVIWGVRFLVGVKGRSYLCFRKGFVGEKNELGVRFLGYYVSCFRFFSVIV